MLTRNRALGGLSMRPSRTAILDRTWNQWKGSGKLEGLSTRILNTLQKNGSESTLRSFYQSMQREVDSYNYYTTTEVVLHRIPNLGILSIKRIKEFLSQLGLDLNWPYNQVLAWEREALLVEDETPDLCEDMEELSNEIQFIRRRMDETNALLHKMLNIFQIKNFVFGDAVPVTNLDTEYVDCVQLYFKPGQENNMPGTVLINGIAYKKETENA